MTEDNGSTSPRGATGETDQPPDEPPRKKDQSAANNQDNAQKDSGQKQKKPEPPLLMEKAPEQHRTANRAGKSGRALAWLALFMALFGAAAGGYSYWVLGQYKKFDIAAARDNEQRTLDRVFKRTATLEQGVVDNRASAQEQQRSLEELNARVTAVRRQIGEITHVSRKSWMLAEAEYLLRLANQRLVMEQEAASALALLQAADQILLESDDINLHQVRAEIARETAALRAAGDIDVEGVFLTLGALADRLADLPLLSPRPEAESSDTGDFFTDGLDNALAHLEQLVTVRHRDKPVAPLLPPEQHYYVQQNLRLMLEQAQLALLQRKPSLYLQSLTKAERWIGDYFELNSASTALLETIADLKQLNIAPPLPDISKSLALLKHYLANPDQVLEAAPAEEEVPQ